MSEKRAPTHRIKYRDRETKVTYDVATVWPGRFPDSGDISPVLETDTTGKYPRMAFADAVRLASEKRGWLSLSSAGRKKAPRQSSNDFADDGFGGDDVPF